MNSENDDYGYVTVTKIKTDDPKVLKTIIKDGELDLTATPSKGTHTLKNFNSNMCRAEIETKDGSFCKVVKKLHRLYPNAHIYYEIIWMYYDEEFQFSPRMVYQYKDGDYERLYKGDH